LKFLQIVQGVNRGVSEYMFRVDGHVHRWFGIGIFSASAPGHSCRNFWKSERLKESAILFNFPGIWTAFITMLWIRVCKTKVLTRSIATEIDDLVEHLESLQNGSWFLSELSTVIWYEPVLAGPLKNGFYHNVMNKGLQN
jgi:hypothetical protein